MAKAAARLSRLLVLAVLCAAALQLCSVRQPLSQYGAAAAVQKQVSPDVEAVVGDDAPIDDVVNEVAQSIAAVDDEEGENEEELEKMYAREAERQREQETYIAKAINESRRLAKKKRNKIIAGSVGGVAAALLAAAMYGLYRRRNPSSRGYEKI